MRRQRARTREAHGASAPGGPSSVSRPPCLPTSIATPLSSPEHRCGPRASRTPQLAASAHPARPEAPPSPLAAPPLWPAAARLPAVRRPCRAETQFAGSPRAPSRATRAGGARCQRPACAQGSRRPAMTPNGVSAHETQKRGPMARQGTVPRPTAIAHGRAASLGNSPQAGARNRHEEPPTSPWLYQRPRKLHAVRASDSDWLSRSASMPARALPSRD